MRRGWLPGFLIAAAACTPKHAARPTTTATVPTPSVQVGSCGEPGRDGVMGQAPRLEHADRDLDGDGQVEPIVADRQMCTGEGNCYWNVFTRPQGQCPRYAGTFAAAALEPLTSRGEDGMSDIRGYWNLHEGRMLLQTYRFTRGGYRIVDVLLCKRASDDRLDCADSVQ